MNRKADKTAPPPSVIDVTRFDALLVDLDGVVTRTASLHAQAWKHLFDDFLRARAEREGVAFEPFDLERDYRAHVDGKPRFDGVRAFLAARGITVPEGAPEDAPERDTVYGLGNRKNAYFHRLLAERGVEVYDHAVAFLRRARDAGLALAVISSSRNCAAVLEAAGLADLFAVRIDGVERGRLSLAGKPAPDTFLAAARRLGVEPARAVVFEDALAGVEAGRAGGFGLVVGVDRVGQAAALRGHGADIVIDDFARLGLVGERPAGARAVPSALDSLDAVARRIAGREVAVFLDYDGTLTPIVDRPELAVLSAAMRATVARLAALTTVAIISGRGREDVTRLVGIDGIVYAGSHGFDIAGPGIRREMGGEYVEPLREAAAEIGEALAGVDGVIVEDKRYAVAVHYRLVEPAAVPRVEAAVDAALARHPGLRKTGGKKIFELRPAIDWDKGRAVLWLMTVLGLDHAGVVPFYLGDDLTDRDAFRALRETGVGILVTGEPRPTLAHYRLHDTGEVRTFLAWLADTLEATRK